MDMVNYYENLIYLSTSNSNNIKSEENNIFLGLFEIYPKINSITIDEIDEFIADTNNELLKILYRELKYLKEYKIIEGKYNKVFTIIKQTRNTKEENEIEEIKNNYDIQCMINYGEELLESNSHLFYVGIYMSQLYDKLNQIDESIRILNKLLEWYSNSRVIKKYIYQTIIDVYFRNKINKVKNNVLQDNHNLLTVILYKLGKFSHYHTLLFTYINFFFFVVLWFVIGKYILLMFISLVLINLFCLLISIRIKRLILYGVYIQKILLFVYAFTFSTILYLVIQAIFKM